MAEKTINAPILYRMFDLDRAGMDEEKRTVPLAFSSEEPVERWFGIEILDHNPSSVDMSRLSRGAPLLLEHDRGYQIGVVESASIDKDKKGRAVVRFSKSQRGEEIFQDVKDRIRQLVSVGYRINTMVTEKVEQGVETLRATRWTPLEISIVSVPADASVGIGRTANQTNEPISIEPMRTLLDPAPAAAPVAPPTGGGAPISGPATATLPAPVSNNDRAEIESIANYLTSRGVQGVADVANRAITEGISVAEFRKRAMAVLPSTTPIRAAEPLDVKPKEWAKYSIQRAIRMMLPGEKPEGFEKEMSDEVSLKAGRKPEGVWLPREALAYHQRNFIAGTGTLGGMLVDTQNLGSQFIEVLRNRAKVAMLGARILNLSNPVTIPRQNAAGSVNWVGETVAATLSTGNFTQITLTPQGLSAFQQYGKQLLFESDPSIDQLISGDITQIIALEIDRVVLHGTGSGQPTGITAGTGVTTIAISANGSAFTVANGRQSMVSLETAVATANADVGNMAYLTNAKMRGRLKNIDENLSTNAARWVWQGGQNGEVNGYRAEVSNQVSAIQTQGTATTICSSVFFGNWQEVLIANFNNGATDLVVDPYVLAVNGVVRVIARHWVDIGIRHGASFAVLLGVLDS